MKKLLITTIVATAVASTAFSQGLVNFSTGATAGNHISTNSVVGGPATGITGAGVGLYYYALFASSSQTSINGNTAAVNGVNANYVFNNLGGGTASTGWVLVGIGESQAAAGRQGAVSQGTTSGNQGAINADNSITVQGIAGAAIANLVSIGWSADIGTTLAQAEAWYAAPGTGGVTTGWFGQSAVASGATLGDGALVITPNAMGSGVGQFPGFVLGEITVPEPGTLALAALGASSLLLFRRKK